MPYSGESTQTEHGAMVPVIWYLLIPVLGFAVLLPIPFSLNPGPECVSRPRSELQ